MSSSSSFPSPSLDASLGPPPAKGRGAAVEFRHVSVRYGSGRDGVTAAVNDLSLRVSPGDICVLVGPSGCGKTSTLRLVNRLLTPASGQVLIDDQDVAGLDPVCLRRRIGYVIQQVGLFPHQTIAANVGTVPRLLNWPPDRIRRRVDELLALTGLDPARMRDRYPAQLSGGERQRVGVARALAAEPPLLLMDEPFAAVDPIVRERLQDEFLRLQRALGPTVLFVTHDVDEAIKLATHVAVMRHDGRVAQYSPPAELLTSPADEYVGRFVGADRTLKRLTLITVRDLRLGPAPGDDGIPAVEMPAVSSAANARDALAAVLASPAREAKVVDGKGRCVGVVTLNTIAALLAAPAEAPQPPPGDADARDSLVRRGRAGSEDIRDAE